MKSRKFAVRAKRAVEILAVVLLITGAGGCGLPGIAAPVVREQLYPRTLHQVWKATESTLAQQGVVINAADVASGTMTYTTLLQEKDLKESVLEGKSGSSEGAAYTTVFMREKAGMTLIRAYTKVKAAGLEALLPSSGEIERKLFSGLRGQLGSPDLAESKKNN